MINRYITTMLKSLIMVYLLALSFSSIAAERDLSDIAYRAFYPAPPAGYHGPLFKLKHDYPAVEPPQCTPARCPWLFIPVQFTFNQTMLSSEWAKYAQSIASLVKKSFYISYNQVDTRGDWYGMPWLTTKPDTAQEFIHGAKYSFVFSPATMGHRTLRHALPKQQTDKPSYEVWGAAYYNDYAAYTLGKIWQKNGRLRLKPVGDQVRIVGLPFKPGAIKIKLNFLSTDHLYPGHHGEEPIVLLNRHAEYYDSDKKVHYDMKRRAILPATLAEIQVGVNDPRSPTNWVFLSFGFNPARPAPASGNLIENFDLLGIQFGNDPETFPAVSKEASQPLHESFVTSFGKSNLEGCYGRLITFLGTPSQSCTGCHQTAYLTQQGTRPFSLDYPSGSCDKEPPNLDLSYYLQNLHYPQNYSKPNAPKNLILLDGSWRLGDAVEAYLHYK